MAEASSWVVETNSATFERDVIDQSANRPVVVDFWAPWCGPCRQLSPVLEKLAAESGGKFALAKVNIDDSPDLAAAFGVQSIPYVVGIRNEKAVNQFLGLLSEAQIREWLNTIVPSPAEELLKQGAALEDQDPAAAEAKYREAAQLDPDDDSVKIPLARVLLKQHREEECRRIVAELEKRGFLETEAEKIKSQLELMTAAGEAGGVDKARKAVEDSPADASLKLKLADTLAVAGQHEEALEICLDLIGQDREGIGVEAKETMVKIFDTLGPESQLASAYRRKLATALY